MLSILELNAGDKAVVQELPADPQMKQLLLVHGIHIGGEIKLMQLFRSQELALIIQNGRKIALRRPDCAGIKVIKVDG